MTVAALPHLWRWIDTKTWNLWEPLQPIPLFGLTVAILVGLAVAFVLFALFLAGHLLVRTLLPSIFAALSPATSVAPWIGGSRRNLVVSVPTGPFRTFSFWRKPEEVLAIRQEAWRAVRPRISAWKHERPLPPSHSVKIESRRIGSRPRIWMIVLGSMLVALAAVLTVAVVLNASNARVDEGFWSRLWRLVPGGAILLGGLALLVMFGAVAARAQRTRARDRESIPDHGSLGYAHYWALRLSSPQSGRQFGVRATNRSWST
jgi:hypothetical protein